MAFIDPVCQMTVNPATAVETAVVAGTRIYFCSAACQSRYLADPAAYPLTEPARAASGPRRGPAIGKAVAAGVAASAVLLVLYFGLLTALSGWDFTRSEFVRFWPYIIALAGGFGVQIALFLHLRGLVHGNHSGKVVAVSGGASGAAMISCCSHYLVNLLPMLGATGLVSLVGQYQVELFWVGIAANLAGIAYIASRLMAFRQEMG